MVSVDNSITDFQRCTGVFNGHSYTRVDIECYLSLVFRCSCVGFSSIRSCRVGETEQLAGLAVWILVRLR